MASIGISDATVVDYAHGLLDHGSVAAGQVERFSLPDLDLTATLASEGYAALCRQALVDDPTYRDGGQSQVAVAVIDHVARPDMPQAHWSSPTFGIGQFIQGLEASGLDGLFDATHTIWQFFSAGRHQGIQTLQATGAYPPWEASFPLRNFLHWSYQAQGMRLVHAATLGRNGRGVLLAGAGGAGKSGTTLAGILHGLTSAGDDYVAIGLEGQQATAYPVIKLMKQDRAGLARLGIDPLERALGEPNWQGKYTFDFEDLVRGARARSLALSGILIPRISGVSKCRISPAPMRDALYGLLPNNLQQLPGGLRQGLSFVAALTRALPAYYLDLSSEPEDIARTISQFLEEDRP